MGRTGAERRRAWSWALACGVTVAVVGAAAPTAVAQAPTPVLAMSFDELQGSKVNDSSPANNDGFITGAQWRADGRFGGALEFDGDDDVMVPDAATLDVTRVTMSAWVRPRTQDRWQTVMIKQNGGDGAYELLGTSGGDTSTFAAWGGNESIYGDEPLPMNKWSHIAATFDGTNWRLYYNGVHVETEDGTPLALSAEELRIGNTDRWTGQGWDGWIDEVRIYGTALTEAEIARDMNARIKSDTEDVTPAVLAMSFDDGAGGTVTDSSTYGNHGTIRGAQWTTTGRFGKALRFDGIDDFVTVNDAASLDLTNAQTVEAWVKLDKAKQWHTVATKELSTNNLSYYLAASAWAATDGPIAKLSQSAADTSNFWTAWRATPLDPGKWYHLAYTFDGTTIRLYVDGVQAATGTTTGIPPTSNEPLRIGGTTNWGPTHYLDGTIDELRVYNRVLTASQITTDRETSIRSGALAGGDGEDGPLVRDAAGGTVAGAAAPQPSAAAVPAPAAGPDTPAAARKPAAKRKARCRIALRKVVVRIAGKRRTVVKRACVKAKPKKAVKRRAARRQR